MGGDEKAAVAGATVRIETNREQVIRPDFKVHGDKFRILLIICAGFGEDKLT